MQEYIQLYTSVDLPAVLALVTLKVSEELRLRMRKFPYINWSEVARSAIEERLNLEESLERRSINPQALDRAIAIQDAIRAKSLGKWSLSREIRRWRELRR